MVYTWVSGFAGLSLNFCCLVGLQCGGVWLDLLVCCALFEFVLCCWFNGGMLVSILVGFNSVVIVAVLSLFLLCLFVLWLLCRLVYCFVIVYAG